MIHGYHTIIDSEWLARIAGTTKTTAMADQLWFRDGVPKKVLTLSRMREEITRKHEKNRGNKSKKEIVRLRKRDERRFVYGMMEEGKGWWDMEDELDQFDEVVEWRN